MSPNDVEGENEQSKTEVKTPLTNIEFRQLNNLFYGGTEEEEDQNGTRNEMENFSLEEFANEINEEEPPSEAAAATAAAFGTAVITTASYFIYKFMQKRK